MFFLCAFAFSCTDNSSDQFDRTEFILENKDNLEQAYLELRPDVQKQLWLDKISNSKFIFEDPKIVSSIAHLTSILSSSDFSRNLLVDKEFNSIVVSLANSMSKSDFLNTFASIRDIDQNINASDDKCIECIQDIESQLLAFIEGPDPDKKCNCRWTCGDLEGVNSTVCVTDVCTETVTGCGFLWLFSCRKRDISELTFQPGDCD